MARQTPREKIHPLAVQFYERYVRFSEQLHNAWMYFEVQTEILRLVEESCQNEEYKGKIQIASTSPINSEKRAPSHLRGGNLPGFITRNHRKEIPETVLLNSVSLFEAFVSDIAKLVYLVDPARLLATNPPPTENETGRDYETAQLLSMLINSTNKDEVLERYKEHRKGKGQKQPKLLNIIIASSSKEEALEHYIDEKLRGIFYGNPVDVFEKNKLGFDLHERMGKDCTEDLSIYAEIVARRNVIVHNLGRVDRKYIREIEGTTLNMGETINVDREYLFRSLHTINDLAKRYVTEISILITGKQLPSIRMGIHKSD